jgi:hypothetical protein
MGEGEWLPLMFFINVPSGPPVAGPSCESPDRRSVVCTRECEYVWYGWYVKFPRALITYH